MRFTAVFLILAAIALGSPLGGCNGPQPSIREGDAQSVEIMYAGNVATAMPLAAQHCARYERVARLVDPGIDHALFACDRK